MRALFPAVVLTLTALPVGAQDVVPSNLTAIEEARSSMCVPVLIRAEQIEARLAPLADRSRRLLEIGDAIALEDRSIIESLDADDPVEARVRAWFDSDQALAEQFVATSDSSIVQQRTAGREVIRGVMQEAVGSVQTEADSVIAANQDMAEAAGECDGAILLRPVVAEACADSAALVCTEAAAAPSPQTRFRFVDDAESLWAIQELRPWNSPSRLQPSPDGQLGGGRTAVTMRTGNLVVTAGFSPLLQDRSEVAEDLLAAYQAVADSLGLEFSHEQIAFVPALGVRVNLPEPIGGETRYLLHFGPPSEPEVLWQADAGSGTLVDATVPLRATHVLQLAEGAPLTFTAIAAGEAGELEARYLLALPTVNQMQSVSTLLGYMAQQFSLDLNELVPPRGAPLF